MPRSVRAVLVVALVSACTADFFLEQDTDASTTGTASTGGATTDPSGSMGSAEGSSSMGATTTTMPTTEGSGDTTTAGAQSETTEGVSAEATGTGTTGPGEETTTATSVEEATTDPSGGEGGGVLDCPDQPAARACDAQPVCDWFGEAGACFADPCHPDAEIACNELVFAACNEAPLCTWFGDVEAGECAYAPCGKLDIEACTQSAACVWVEGEGICMFVECPACFDLGELDCQGNEACTWLDAQAACVPD